MSQARYVIQHDHNPMMFLVDVGNSDGTETIWTHDIGRARKFVSERSALRFIVNWLKGKGYVLPVIQYRRAAA